MRENGWLLPPGEGPKATLTAFISGDPRLPDAAYPFVRRTLDRLLARHLPAVRVVFVWRTPGADTLVSRYARERRLPFDFVAGRGPEELVKTGAGAVVVFDGGGKESDALMRETRARRLPVRVIDVRRFVTPASP